jgi:hypothetical protein
VFVPTDAAGFREFVDAHSRDLLRMAWLLTGDWGRGEDLVQAALVRCWPKWSMIEVPPIHSPPYCGLSRNPRVASLSRDQVVPTVS